MTKVAVFAGGDLSYFMGDYDIFVGVDAGSLYLLEKGLPLDIAVGDFDSVTSASFQRIQSEAKRVFRSVPEKDDTDLELALKTIFSLYPTAEVTVFGAFGGRLDHMMSSFFLAAEPHIAPFMRQITLVDELNRVCYYPAGDHTIQPVEGMFYISFMPSDGSKIYISGAKYELFDGNYFIKKCYSSNEFIAGQSIQISLDKGYVVVIYSKDRE